MGTSASRINVVGQLYTIQLPTAIAKCLSCCVSLAHLRTFLRHQTRAVTLQFWLQSSTTNHKCWVFLFNSIATCFIVIQKVTPACTWLLLTTLLRCCPSLHPSSQRRCLSKGIVMGWQLCRSQPLCSTSTSCDHLRSSGATLPYRMRYKRETCFIGHQLGFSRDSNNDYFHQLDYGIEKVKRRTWAMTVMVYLENHFLLTKKGWINPFLLQMASNKALRSPLIEYLPIRSAWLLKHKDWPKQAALTTHMPMSSIEGSAACQRGWLMVRTG